jgi:hypothetical protein
MKRIIILMIIFMFSCQRKDKNNQFVKSNQFIYSPGIYYYKQTKIIIKEFNDGSLIYGIADKLNNIIYQQNINQSFSNNSNWFIFIDKNDNIWFFTSDLQLTTVLTKRNDTYEYKKIANNSGEIPNEMKTEIESNN